MVSGTGSAIGVATPTLVLSLRVRPDATSDWDTKPGALDVAGFLAAMEALGRLSDVATRTEVPIADLVASWTRSPPPGFPAPNTRNIPAGVPRVLRPEADVWWALRREFDISDEEVAPASSTMLRLAADWRDRTWRRPLRIEHLHFGSPLELVIGLPWDWFGPAGGGMVFLKVLEHWLHSPQRIRADHAQLREKAAVHRANEAEARRRELIATRNVERLQSVNNLVEIEDGELHFD